MELNWIKELRAAPCVGAPPSGRRGFKTGSGGIAILDARRLRPASGSGVWSLPELLHIGYPCVPREDLLQTGFRRRSRVIFSTWFRPSRKFIDISSSVTRGACLSPACTLGKSNVSVGPTNNIYCA